MAHPLISDAEMATLTGYETPSKQRRVLDDHGIIYMQDKDGKPRTTWYNFNHPRHLRTAADMDDEPDFAAMGR